LKCGTGGIDGEISGSIDSEVKKERIKRLEAMLNENRIYRRANAVAIQELGKFYPNAPEIVAQLNSIMIEYATNLSASDISPSLPGRLPKNNSSPLKRSDSKSSKWRIRATQHKTSIFQE